jgi:hypothetical protein
MNKLWLRALPSPSRHRRDFEAHTARPSPEGSLRVPWLGKVGCLKQIGFQSLVIVDHHADPSGGLVREVRLVPSLLLEIDA